MIWDEFLRHFRFCDEEDSGLSDEEQERKRNFLEKFKTASKSHSILYIYSNKLVYSYKDKEMSQNGGKTYMFLL